MVGLEVNFGCDCYYLFVLVEIGLGSFWLREDLWCVELSVLVGGHSICFKRGEFIRII